MNITSFLNEIDGSIKSADAEALRNLLHQIARTRKPEERDAFLRLVKDQLKETDDSVSKKGKSKAASRDKSDRDSRKAQILKNLDMINEGSVAISSEYNEEYDDWYGEDDEFIFHDDCGIADMIGEAVDFVRDCMDEEDYQSAYEVGMALLDVDISVTGDYTDYGDDTVSLDMLEEEEFLSFDLEGLLLDLLYVAYILAPPKKRPEELLQIMSRSTVGEISLEQLIQHAPDDLPEFDAFLDAWIRFLGSRNGDMKLLLEAFRMEKDGAKQRKYAAEFADTHPALYEELLANLSIKMKDEERLALGEEAIGKIPEQYLTRSRIAVYAAGCAGNLGMQEKKEELLFEAFRSDTSPLNYLRLCLQCADPLDCRAKMKTIIDDFEKQKSDYDLARVFWQDAETAKNRPAKNEVLLLHFLDGDFNYVLSKGMNVKEGIGWSSTFMKQGLSCFLLYLYKSDRLFQGMNAMASSCAELFYFKVEEADISGVYPKGAGQVDAFWKCFKKWKEMTPRSQEEEDKIIKKLKPWIQKRTESILGARRRNYYGECAAFIAAYGEMAESRGLENKNVWMLQVKNLFPRHTALHSELRRFGMKDGKK